MKRYHDHGNFHKGKHLIVAGLQFERFSPFPSWQEVWQYPGRSGDEEGEESSIS